MTWRSFSLVPPNQNMNGLAQQSSLGEQNVIVQHGHTINAKTLQRFGSVLHVFLNFGPPMGVISSWKHGNKCLLKVRGPAGDHWVFVHGRNQEPAWLSQAVAALKDRISWRHFQQTM